MTAGEILDVYAIASLVVGAIATIPFLSWWEKGDPVWPIALVFFLIGLPFVNLWTISFATYLAWCLFKDRRDWRRKHSKAN